VVKTSERRAKGRQYRGTGWPIYPDALSFSGTREAGPNSPQVQAHDRPADHKLFSILGKLDLNHSLFRLSLDARFAGSYFSYLIWARSVLSQHGPEQHSKGKEGGRIC
jgi:hypothetical protein